MGCVNLPTRTIAAMELAGSTHCPAPDGMLGGMMRRKGEGGEGQRGCDRVCR